LYLLYWIVLFNWFIVLRVINIWGNNSVLVLELILLGINWVNILLLIIVIIVSSYIVLFSIDYLSIIESVLFIVYIVLFCLNMLYLLINYDLIWWFIIWDLLGLISYLLINYHCNKVNTGIKAIIINKFGDVLILYLLIMIVSFNNVLGINCFLLITFVIILLLLLLCFYIINVNILLLFIFTIMFTKSAQFPFISWLLGAMNAPIPVSALLHSSTMVIVGLWFGITFSIIILLLVCYFIIHNIISLLWSVFKVLSVNDIKTIIALSTINQISFMFIIFIINIILCLFHIIVHSLFKMNLFLISSSIIHNSMHYQSTNKIKSINLFLLCIYLVSLLILILSISKELIIFYSYIIFSYFIIISILILGSFFTLVYCLLLIQLLFIY